VEVAVIMSTMTVTVVMTVCGRSVIPALPEERQIDEA